MLYFLLIVCKLDIEVQNMSVFSERLQKLRNRTELSQKDFGAIIGASRDQISNWEQGRGEPDIETITKIADQYKITTDYLLGRTDNPQGNKIETIAAHRTDDPIKQLPEAARKSLEDFKKYLYEKHGLKY